MTALPATRPADRRRLPPQSCSARWDDGDLPAWGTASQAAFWLALEQPGPWGRNALTASRLDPALGAELEQRTARAGGRTLLIRKPGSSADAPVHDGHRASRPRRIYLAVGMPQGSPLLLTGEIDDPAELLRLPWRELAEGHAPTAPLGLVARLRPQRLGVLLVCTNAKRDRCCAFRGLPLAARLHEAVPDRVWECTHTGGHRFAPTGVGLPSGLTLARLDEPTGRELLDSPAGTLPDSLRDATHLRGLAHLPAVLQAADAYARARWDVADLRASTGASLQPGDPRHRPDHQVVAVHPPAPHARKRLLAVRTRTDPADRPASCGADLGPSQFYDVEPLDD